MHSITSNESIQNTVRTFLELSVIAALLSIPAYKSDSPGDESQCDTDTSPDLTEQVENKLSKMNQQTSAAVMSRAEAEMEVVVNNEDYDPYVIVVLNQL